MDNPEVFPGQAGLSQGQGAALSVALAQSWGSHSPKSFCSKEFKRNVEGTAECSAVRIKQGTGLGSFTQAGWPRAEVAGWVHRRQKPAGSMVEIGGGGFGAGMGKGKDVFAWRPGDLI